MAESNSTTTTITSATRVVSTTTAGIFTTEVSTGLVHEPNLNSADMYEVMAAVMSVVLSIIVLIAVAFFVKQHRRRRQNIEILRNRQRRQPIEIFGITRDEESDMRVHNTHQPLYMTPDNHDINSTLTIESPVTQNGNYANSDVVNISTNLMYDLPRPTGDYNTRSTECLVASTQKVTTFGGQIMDEMNSRRGKDHLLAATLDVPNKNKKPNSSIKHSQSLGRYDIETGNHRTQIETNNRECEDIPDYENSPEKVGKGMAPTHKTTFGGRNTPNVNQMIDEMKSRSGKDHLHAATLNVQDNNKTPSSSIKCSQSLGRYDSLTRNPRAKFQRDNHVCEDSPDYENSPEKVRKVKFQQGQNLNTVPPPNNGKMTGLDIQKNSAKPGDKTRVQRQKSDYEDPDNVVAIRNMKMVNESSNDGAPEYSNMIIGLVVKEEIPKYDYENEHSVNELRQKGPPVPTKKRAHTTAAYDRPTRPVVKKTLRTYSESEHKAVDEDDMYLEMDSPDNGVQNSQGHQLKPSPKTKPKPKPLPKPEPLPKPTKNMVPKRSFDKNVLLSVQRPPPCGMNQRSNTEYVNYDENSSYVNLFRSKSNDDVYIYADSHFNKE